jgi:glyoxylase-like metal-dependent hydrolase (beta-lactamase superfamily II)
VTERSAWYTEGPEEVADGVVRLPMPVGVDGLHAVNVYVLRGSTGDIEGDIEGGVDLVDAGDAAEVHPDELDEALRGLGSSLEAVRRILVTHIHPDHYSLAPPIRARSGATLHLGAGEQENLRQLNRLRRGEREPHVLADLARVGGTELTPQLDPVRLHGKRGPELEEPDVWTADGDRLTVCGGRRLTVVSTPGHTRGHVVFHDAARAIWFSGDHVLPHITPSIGTESARRFPTRSVTTSTRFGSCCPGPTG